MQRKPVAPFTPLARAVKASETRSYAHGDVADELLMVRYQRGDRAAFASLVRRHQRGVYNFVLRQISDATIADELAQQVFLRAVQRSGDFKHDSRFRTWLYSIARNVVQEAGPSIHERKIHERSTSEYGPDERGVDGRRASARKSSDSERQDGVMDLHSRPRTDRTSSPPVAEAIVAAVVALPADQREVLLLRELGNLSFKEIAEVTFATEATVKTRTRQALERIQQVLSEFDEYARELK